MNVSQQMVIGQIDLSGEPGSVLLILLFRSDLEKKIPVITEKKLSSELKLLPVEKLLKKILFFHEPECQGINTELTANCSPLNHACIVCLFFVLLVFFGT